jgi:hypothetical protein
MLDRHRGRETVPGFVVEASEFGTFFNAVAQTNGIEISTPFP